MSDELPPKMVKAQLVRLDDNLKQIERRQVAGIQRAPGSLPVLEAFQTFLENEQRKARRRMITVTAVALLLMVGVGVASFLLVRQHVNAASVDFAEVTERTDRITSTLDELKRKQDAELLELENRFREESEEIVSQYSSLQTKQQALAERLGTDTIETMQERLLQLELQNEKLTALLTARQIGNTTPMPTTNTATMAPAATMQTNDSAVASVDASTNTIVLAPAANAQTNATALTPIETIAKPQNAPTNEATATVAATKKAATPSVTVINHPLVDLLTIKPEGQRSGIRWMLPRQFSQE